MPYMEVLDFSWYEAFKNREGQPEADSIMPMMSWGVTLWIIYSPLFFGSRVVDFDLQSVLGSVGYSKKHTSVGL